ncbi:hypothetical protein DERF_011432 [Dermatophagoides farinae]|uniref:Uncharacterized protein n=1 Tax=Dermatophagoides farinae TaxID=6954 RepID=A0A922HSX4_DERFA|nr:hypothetical protein DERF_011432 [Dermatophagoides farinae]
MENKEGRNFQLSSLFVDLYRNEILFSFTFISVLVPLKFHFGYNNNHNTSTITTQILQMPNIAN